MEAFDPSHHGIDGTSILLRQSSSALPHPCGGELDRSQHNPVVDPGQSLESGVSLALDLGDDPGDGSSDARISGRTPIHDPPSFPSGKVA
jgi:hypothetical protein